MRKTKRKPKRTSAKMERQNRDVLRLIVEALPAEELPDLLAHASELLDKHVPRLEQLPEPQLADMEALARQHGFIELADQIFQERNRRHETSSRPTA